MLDIAIVCVPVAAMMKSPALTLFIFSLLFTFIHPFSLSSIYDQTISIFHHKRSIPTTDTQIHPCSVQKINGINHLDLKRFSGDWYEISKTATSVPFFKSSVWRFQPIENSRNLAFFFSARVESGHCLNPIAGEVMVSTTNLGTLLLSYDGLKGRVEEEMKVIYTDYDNLAVFYACRHVITDSGGSCHPQGVFASVLSRHHILTQSSTLSNISEIINSFCVDLNHFIPQNASKSCNLDELDVRDYKDTTSEGEWPVCKHAAVCTLACPPCCREDENGCIVCDCRNIPKDNKDCTSSDKCTKPSGCIQNATQCPNDCHVVERIKGCKECLCTDIGNVAHLKAPPANTKDFHVINSIHDCPTTCRTVTYEDKMYCNCTNRLTCKLPMVKGECKASHQRYYFEAKDETCHAFIYGGCGGNENNFASLMECYAMCKDVCDLPVDPGPESGNKIDRFYYNRVTETCSTFSYNGQGGNENNFDSYNACKMRCPEKTIDKDKNKLEICHLTPQEGSCKNMSTAWYFDPTSRKCNRFFYSGCSGNSNRFNSQTECESKCFDAPSGPGRTCDCQENCVAVPGAEECTCDCPNTSASIHFQWISILLSWVLLYFT